MEHSIRSIRPFIGALDFRQSRRFYTDIGFTEGILDNRMSVFTIGKFAFYLQDYDAAEWIDNTMIFLEVDDLNDWHKHHLALNLPSKYPGVRLSEIVSQDWGSEYFLHDPSGILWHIGSFRVT